MALVIAFVGLLLLSAFSSASETALMVANRYRLNHSMRKGSRPAAMAVKLLEQPRHLLGLILLVNNFANLAASALSSLIAYRLFGEAGIAVATGILTIVVLIVAEVAPKTLAAAYADRLAPWFALFWTPLLALLRPLVILLLLASTAVLRLFGLRDAAQLDLDLNRDELRTLLSEKSRDLSPDERRLLLRALDLESLAVEDVMVPRAEIVGLDLKDSEEELLRQVREAEAPVLPVYTDEIEHFAGFVRVNSLIDGGAGAAGIADRIRQMLLPPRFIPEGTSVAIQLLNFRRNGERIGIVIDEYNSIIGMFSLEDLLTGLVGHRATEAELNQLGEDLVEVSGTLSLRTLNEAMGWRFDIEGPRTVNGLILERLGNLPAAGEVIECEGYSISVLESDGRVVRKARIRAPPRAAEGAR